MKRFACNSCGYSPTVSPRTGTWICPKCGTRNILLKRKIRSIVDLTHVKKDPEIERLVEPLDRMHMPPPREKMFLFYRQKKKDR